MNFWSLSAFYASSSRTCTTTERFLILVLNVVLDTLLARLWCFLKKNYNFYIHLTNKLATVVKKNMFFGMTFLS